MCKLTKEIAKVVSFPPEIQNGFYKIAKEIHLQPGNFLTQDLPFETTLFVESGLLSYMFSQENKIQIDGFYFSGSAKTFYNEENPIHEEDVEYYYVSKPTKIYYLTPHDEELVKSIFPDYDIAIKILKHRTLLESEELKNLYVLPELERIKYLEAFYPAILGASVEYLMEYFQLGSDKVLKKALIAAQRKLGAIDS